MPFERSAAGANQFMREFYAVLLGHRGDQARQVVPLRKAVANEKDTD